MIIDYPYYLDIWLQKDKLHITIICYLLLPKPPPHVTNMCEEHMMNKCILATKIESFQKLWQTLVYALSIKPTELQLIP